MELWNFDCKHRLSRPAISRRRFEQLVEGLRSGRREQVLMGVTGSGKTFTMANVIQHVQRPTLVLSHNKTLAAQLYSEFKEFFPHNAVQLLRQLLRLLPARSVHPAARHLHRERRLDQRGDRPAAAGDDQRAGQPARRDHRGQRVVHLRLGLAGGLQGDDGRRCAVGDVDRPRRRCWRSWSTFSTSGTTSIRRAASSACAAIRVEVWPSYEEFAFRIEFWGDEIEQLSIINPDQRRNDRQAGASCSSTRPSTS